MNECLKAICDRYSVSIDKKYIMLTIKLSDYMEKPWSHEDTMFMMIRRHLPTFQRPATV